MVKVSVWRRRRLRVRWKFVDELRDDGWLDDDGWVGGGDERGGGRKEGGWIS